LSSPDFRGTISADYFLVLLQTRLARAVTAQLGLLPGRIEVAVRAILASLLRIATLRLALLGCHFVIRFSLGDCNLEFTFGGCLAGVLSSTGCLAGVTVSRCIGDVLLRVSHVFAGVRLRIGHIALGVSLRIRNVMAHFGRRFSLVAACKRKARGYYQ
jgi:hypothetical protein